MKNLVLWFFLIVSDTGAQLMMKTGAVKAASTGWLPNGFILAGYALYVLSFAIWMQLLKDTRLFIALSGSSVVYITIAFASALLLGEAITGRVMAGTVLISLGVFLIGAGRQREH